MDQDAINYAKTQAELVKKQQQYQIDQAKLAEAERIKALGLAKQQQLSQIALQKTKEEESAKSLQQQEYLQKMQNQKQMNENLIRNGLGTTGARETTLSNLYANYGDNINKINASKLSALRDLSQSENDAEFNYGQSVSNVTSEEAVRRAQIQSGIDELALNQYNTSYAQYVAQKQYEDSLKQQAIENSLNRQNYSSYNNFSDVKQEQQQPASSSVNAYGNSSEIINSKNYYFSNGYQPQYVNNSKLSKSGIKLGTIFGSSLGTTRTEQNIWKAGSKYYIWLGIEAGYKDVTNDVINYYSNKSKIISGGGSGSSW